MVRIKLITGVFLLASQLVVGQSYQTAEEVDTACSQLGFMGENEAEATVDEILNQVGLFRNFVIAECPDINNAIAKNIELEDGTKARYILYDGNFFDKIEDRAASGWAATSILAHEIGHHLNGHSLNNQGSNHKWELEADEFSGFILAKMGATVEEAQSALATLKYEKATRTHPAKADRLAAVQKGWSRASGKIIINDDIAVVIEENNSSETEDANSDIAQAVLTKYIDAIGGVENIAKIKTMIKEMDMDTELFMPGMESTSTMKFRQEFLSPVINKSSYDGMMGAVENLSIGPYLYTKTEGQDSYIRSETGVKEEDSKKASYIPEYQYLVGNFTFDKISEETMDGQKYYVLQLPAVDRRTENVQYNQDMSTVTSNYYNADTGLLDYVVNRVRTKTDWFEENQYMKDSDVVTVMTSKLSDYRAVEGVLFPFKMVMEMGEADKDPQSKTTSTTTKLQINPSLDPEDFKVEAGSKVVSMKEFTQDNMDKVQEFTDGINMLATGNCQEGIARVKKAAEEGTLQAQVIMAQLYDQSYYACANALAKDEQQAVYWYEQSADKSGGEEAMRKLAEAYDKGKLGLSKDKTKALQLYLRATRTTMSLLVNPLDFKAIKSLKKSGNPSAADLQYIESLELMSKGKESQAMTVLTAAAEAGSANAQVALGQAYIMKGDMNEYNKWVKKAADQGDAHANSILKPF